MARKIIKIAENASDSSEKLSNKVAHIGETTQQNASMIRTQTSIPTANAPTEARKRRKTFRFLLGWPLVVLSIIQITSHLLSQESQNKILDESIAYPPNNQLQSERANQADRIFNFIHARQHDSNRAYPKNENTYHVKASSRGAQKAITDSEYLAESSSRHEQASSGLLSKSLVTYLTSHLKAYTSNIQTILSQTTSTTIFGPTILLADAVHVPINTMYQANHGREIIVLDSTNFNAELMQHNHPFPHIKLIEYYLAYCGICLRFKPTYIQLAKEIQPWRNVIRPSAIDLGVSSNTLVANWWSIDVIPTLRIHPPPSPSLSAKMNKHLQELINQLTQGELLKSFSEDYKAANLTIELLGVTKYTYDAKKEALSDKVNLLKQDLLRYIERYVDQHPDELPSTWPNLKPVSEGSLVALRRLHPRQELFLIIEFGGRAEGADQSSQKEPSLGLQIMMELSSSSASKAIRYVRASENKALIEDVISHMRKESSELIGDQQGSNNNQSNVQQMDLLISMLDSGDTNKQHVVLIHIDDSHSPYGHSSNRPATKFPSLTVVTNSDLVEVEQQFAQLDSAGRNNENVRAKRSISNNETSQRARRALLNDDDDNKMSLQRRIQLVAHYINQTYMEIEEDREFVKALSSFDENPTSHNLKREVVDKFQAIQQKNQISLSDDVLKSRQNDELKKNGNSTLKQILGRIDLMSSNSLLSTSVRDQDCQADDYGDKLKALRYIFFQEVPRKSHTDKTPAEKLEKLNILVNLVAAVKAYFPLPDLASAQFIDGIQSYLTKQQALLSASLSDQQERGAASAGIASFDFRALKQVIKSLEAEGKRLPEIKDWQHCRSGGYPCALWRLFHTLTAFEYKKLSQISQQSHFPSKQVSGKQQQQNATASLVVENQPLPIEQQPPQAQEVKPISAALENNNGSQSPVERVVSPPSTTTSLSLTIATPINSQDHQHGSADNQNNNGKQVSEAGLPEPVLLVMRDYITNFFSCEECAKNFKVEAIDLSFDRIRRHEPPEFSILWLWETHNRVSKRLSVNPETNPPEHPKKWFPSFEQCPKCYNKPPSYLKDANVELAAIFHESIDWNRGETLNFLVSEFTRQPMDKGSNLFGYPVPFGFNFVIVIGIGSLLLIILLRCASCYIERQRRHKASLLNGNGAHYSVELQSR